METKKQTTLLRWSVLIIVIIHILYVSFYDLIVKENTIPYITQKYKSLFVPAGYTFGIWAFIYVTLIIYSIYQLLPAQRKKYIYNEIALPLMIVMTLGIWWGVLFHLEMFGLSMMAIFGMIIFTYSIYRSVRKSILYGESEKLMLFPFSILLGWLAAAIIANFTIWLVATGTIGSFLSEIVLTRLIFVALVIFAITFSFKYWDYLYTLTISWALIGIYIARKDAEGAIATPAFICSIVLILWSMGIFFMKRQPRLEDLPRR